jgi:hypothetical protein
MIIQCELSIPSENQNQVFLDLVRSNQTLASYLNTETSV